MLAHISLIAEIDKITFSRDHRVLKKNNLLLLNGLYILTGFRSLCTKPQVKINITALLKLEESGGPTALREMSSPHTRATAIPLPSRRVQTCTEMSIFYTWSPVFKRGFATLTISIRLQVKPFFFFLSATR